ncbi:hypothetical protein LTR85_006383 [Meristemomyces frigidus]|nr:hypothetical protein LTR85_006383 [Meristemomyces frigidus]
MALAEVHAARQMTLANVRAAHERIKPMIHHTPMMMSDSLSQIASTRQLKIRFFIKCENLQKSGSFKFRGASNFMAQQSDAALRRGVVAVTTGNFGQAVALAARTASRARSFPIHASVVLPATSAPSKIEGTKRNGATVVLAGSDPEDRERVAKQILQYTGGTLIGPMDDPRIVHGQGTATLELMDQVRESAGETLDAMVLPSGTGGILAGAGIVCEDTDTMVFGCEPSEGGPDLQRGLASGVLSRPKKQTSVADGLRAATSKGNFDLIRQKRLVDEVYTVPESEIKQAWRLLMEQLRVIVEPSSAVSIALVLFNEGFRSMLAARKSHWNIGIVLTGGNTTVTRMLEEFEGGRRGVRP